ncbi:MAG: biotin/lipoyl-binding protein [Anaerolineae bacterium]|nr:biotin/lipoyl-binding protein [Anaerolineae bacterium]
MKYVTTINNKAFEIEIQRDGSLLVNGEQREVDFLALGPSLYSILMDGLSHELVIEERDNDIEVLLRGKLYSGTVLDERAQLMAERTGGMMTDTGEMSVKAPMPGLVVIVPVEVGQEVRAGQTVIVLESMKMQNELKSPRDGVVQSVNVTAGQSVEQNKILITIAEPASDEE